MNVTFITLREHGVLPYGDNDNLSFICSRVLNEISLWRTVGTPVPTTIFCQNRVNFRKAKLGFGFRSANKEMTVESLLS